MTLAIADRPHCYADAVGLCSKVEDFTAFPSCISR